MYYFTIGKLIYYQVTNIISNKILTNGTELTLFVI